MASKTSSNEPAQTQCTLCASLCSGSRASACHICHANYCCRSCLVTDAEIHQLLCRWVDRELPPDTRRAVRFACDRSRPDFVWLAYNRDQADIVAMFEPLESTVRRTPLLFYADFPWWQASLNDGTSVIHNPIRDRPMRRMRVLTTPYNSHLENKSIERVLGHCEDWLDLEFDIRVPPVESRITRRLKSWRGDLIFDIETEESTGINMADVRDIVDFISVCQEHPQVGRGEMAARAQKLQVVVADNHDMNESSADAKPTFEQHDWPLDHPMLQRWRPQLRSCSRGQNHGRLTSNAGSATLDIYPPLERVLKELRLPILTGEIKSLRTSSSDKARNHRVYLRKDYQDIDIGHVRTYMDFFTNTGRMMKDAFPPTSSDRPSITMAPWMIRRLWQFRHYSYGRTKCIVPGCRSYRDCPLKPESHECWSVMGKELSKKLGKKLVRGVRGIVQALQRKEVGSERGICSKVA